MRRCVFVRRCRSTPLVALVATILAACSTSSTVPPVAKGTGPGMEPAVDAAPPDTGPATCNDVANVGPEVVVAWVNDAPPTVTGGHPVPDGTYVLVKETRYVGKSGAPGAPFPVHETWAFASAAGKLPSLAIVHRAGSGADVHDQVAPTYSGSTLDGTITCADDPADAFPSYSYDATQPPYVRLLTTGADGVAVVETLQQVR